MTYTPGPWWVDDALSRAHHRYDEGTRCINANGNDGAVTVALTTRGGEIARHEADARLIAAAPELLSELKRLLARFITCARSQGNSDHTIAIAVETARRIITKAEGPIS